MILENLLIVTFICLFNYQFNKRIFVFKDKTVPDETLVLKKSIMQFQLNQKMLQKNCTYHNSPNKVSIGSHDPTTK